MRREEPSRKKQSTLTTIGGLNPFGPLLSTVKYMYCKERGMPTFKDRKGQRHGV